jgi:hypothetical protein
MYSTWICSHVKPVFPPWVIALEEDLEYWRNLPQTALRLRFAVSSFDLLPASVKKEWWSAKAASELGFREIPWGSIRNSGPRRLCPLSARLRSPAGEASVSARGRPVSATRHHGLELAPAQKESVVMAGQLAEVPTEVDPNRWTGNGVHLSPTDRAISALRGNCPFEVQRASMGISSVPAGSERTKGDRARSAGGSASRAACASSRLA